VPPVPAGCPPNAVEAPPEPGLVPPEAFPAPPTLLEPPTLSAPPVLGLAASDVVPTDADAVPPDEGPPDLSTRSPAEEQPAVASTNAPRADR
jgi:hypothetical protein